MESLRKINASASENLTPMTESEVQKIEAVNDNEIINDVISTEEKIAEIKEHLDTLGSDESFPETIGPRESASSESTPKQTTETINSVSNPTTTPSEVGSGGQPPSGIGSTTIHSGKETKFGGLFKKVGTFLWGGAKLALGAFVATIALSFSGLKAGSEKVLGAGGGGGGGAPKKKPSGGGH